MSSAMKMLMVLGGVMTHMPHEMFPNILNTNDSVPTHPKTLKDDYYRSASESDRRSKAALAKRERRAEKLRQIHEDKSWTEFNYKGERWCFNEHSVACWDDELGFEFRFYHRQDKPTANSIIEYLNTL